MSSDFDHWHIKATVYDDRVEEQHFRSDPAKNIRRQQYTKVWHVEQFLGSGGNGEVRLERNRVDGKARAVKRVVATSWMPSKSECERELKALLEFSKPKSREAAVFVDFFGWFNNGPYIYLAMEYFQLGDLEKNVRAHSGRRPEVETRRITEQLLSGLQIMHAESFAHRDLKPQNVLVVNGPPQWWVKLADFGLSKSLTDMTTYTSRAGTQSYMAPEVLKYLDSTQSEPNCISAVDLWAVGCIVYRLIVGVVPFPPGTSLMKYCEDQSRFPSDALKASGMTDNGSAFIRELLVTNPQDRLSASQALQHQWLHSSSTSMGNIYSESLGEMNELTPSGSSFSVMEFNSVSHAGLKSYESTKPYEKPQHFPTKSAILSGSSPAHSQVADHSDSQTSLPSSHSERSLQQQQIDDTEVRYHSETTVKPRKSKHEKSVESEKTLVDSAPKLTLNQVQIAQARKQREVENQNVEPHNDTTDIDLKLPIQNGSSFDKFLFSKALPQVPSSRLGEDAAEGRTSLRNVPEVGIGPTSRPRDIYQRTEDERKNDAIQELKGNGRQSIKAHKEQPHGALREGDRQQIPSSVRGVVAKAKAFLGKPQKNRSSAGKLPVIDDEQPKFKVINQPLVAQTRLTRIAKSLLDAMDKTEFWIPALPWRVIDYLNYYFDSDEIYRLPSRIYSPRAKMWQRRFDDELDIDLRNSTDKVEDISVLGFILLSWLRALPDEIFPKSSQDRIARDCSVTELETVLSDEISALPPFNYYLLFAITGHLSLLLAHSEKNAINFQTLCNIFQPCLRIDDLSFSYLVLHWRNCWKGCKTEEAFLEKELQFLHTVD